MHFYLPINVCSRYDTLWCLHLCQGLTWQWFESYLECDIEQIKELKSKHIKLTMNLESIPNNSFNFNSNPKTTKIVLQEEFSFNFGLESFS